MTEPSGRSLTFLWFIDFDYSTRLHHGATLRYFNYSRELLAVGHQVYFVIQLHAGEAKLSRAFLSELKQQGTFTNFFNCTYSCPRWKRRIATLAILPSLANRWLAQNRLPALKYSQELAATLRTDICIFSDRKFLFLLPSFAKLFTSIIDFGDCSTLYHSREARLIWRNHDPPEFLTCLRSLSESCLQERYYGRLSHSNIVVSHVDKRVLDRITNIPERTHVLLNGVSIPSHSPYPPKVTGRLIFSGNMDFPPNCQAAIWFIDNVFPLVRRARPDAHFVVAGANPLPELLRRACDSIRVTGYIADMNHEIAASSLYVAPLITGGGFKNKVIEALANRTYVAGTPMALEFLDAETRSKILVGDSAEALANRIVQFLSRPEHFEQRLSELNAMIFREFTWTKRTVQLLSLVANACERLNPDLACAPALLDC
jgi:glycosyltransferase involved in cell wall biosynthesis